MAQTASPNRSPAAAASAPVMDALERETVHRVAWRLMPMLMLGYFCAYLDRVNVGFAGLTMNKALGFSSAVFGFGAGVFFFGYFLAEIPSNLILNKVGARRWIARILLTWGVISGADRVRLERLELLRHPLPARAGRGGVLSRHRAVSDLVVPVLLPVAHAGDLPVRQRDLADHRSAGVGLAVDTGRRVGLARVAVAVPGRGGAADHHVRRDVVPADRPSEGREVAASRTADWLQGRLDSEQAQREAVHNYRLGEAMANPRVWLLTVVYFGQNVSNYGLLIFLPQIVKSFGISTQMTGLISALPFVFAAVAMIYWGFRSDHSGDRALYVASACALCAAGLAACSFIGIGNPVWMMVALILGIMGQQSIAPTFWPLPTAMLSGIAAAGGIALINAVGNLGGFLGPYMFGLIKDATGGSDFIALLALAAAPVICTVILLLLGHDRRLERIPVVAA